MISARTILFACVYLSPWNNQVSQVTVVDIEQLQHRVIKPSNDTLYVVNFWATWCKPCVQELPYFEKALESYKNQKVKIILVSLDSPEEGDKVQKFATLRNLRNEMYILNGGNPNVWINAIDSSWSGAIPATIYYKTGRKVAFHEGDYTDTELDSTIRTAINK